MNLPKTSEDLKIEIFKSVDKLDKIGDLRIRQLTKILSKVNDQIIIDGIIEVFENEDRSEKLYADQKNAGIILKKLNPKTKVSIESILDRTLKNWNKSVEELPFWLKDNYGMEALKKAFSKMENSNLTELEADKINTMRWWLNIESEIKVSS